MGANARGRGWIALLLVLVLLVAGFGVSLAIGEARAASGTEHADLDLATAWGARVLLALTIAWLVIGMLSSRTRLVRRPGAAAARASWMSATRPWRAEESTLGMLGADRVLLVALPAALLVATGVLRTSLLSWTLSGVIFGAWVVFLVVMLLVSRRRSPWPVIAVVGGVTVLRCAVTLVMLSLGGPDAHGPAIWADPVFRTIHLTLEFALFAWMIVAAIWVLAGQFRRR